MTADLAGSPQPQLPPEYSPRTIPELLARRARRAPSAAAVSGGMAGSFRTISYSELDACSTAVARRLRASHGVRQGSVIAWALDNSAGAAALVIYHALAKAGAVNVPLNPRLSPDEMHTLLSHCRAEMLIADAVQLASRYADARDPDVACVDLAGLRPGDPRDVDCDPLPLSAAADLVSILYTSGTTGLPKGVEHTHSSSLAAAIAWADCFRLTDSDVLQSPFPIVSGAGLHFNALSSMWAGGHVVVDEPALPGSFTRIEQLRSTVYVAVPSIYQYWLRHPELASHDLSSLRVLDYGGSSMAPAVIGKLRERLPDVAFMQTYGFTEAGPGGTYLPEDYTDTRPGSIGCRAAGRHSRFKVVDEQGEPVGPGVPGELYFSGPSVMRGYHRDPKATAEVFTDGWLRSGDIVSYDDEGFLYFVDRKRELIVRGGYNIAPFEIEQVLLSHPAVAEAAVFGVPHETLGEVPVAAVVLCAGSAAGPDELRSFCGEKLADFKVPRDVVPVGRLPRNAAGKTLKSELRTSYLAQNRQNTGRA